MKKRALLSVSDKTKIVQFARELTILGFEIISTDGTLAELNKAGVNALAVEDVTGFPEILDGRVKTLHPVIHGGLLAVHDNPRHMTSLKIHNISPIELVAVNLYPFQNTIQKPDINHKEAIENIDIGGPCMLRSGAKNYENVVVVVDPEDYDAVLEQLRTGITIECRKKLAGKVFRHVAAYDAIIAGYLTSDINCAESITLTYQKLTNLRYGENPHQQAAFYRQPTHAHGTITFSNQLHGKELSYNNINDANVALSLVKEFEKTAAVVVKHMNPCSVAIKDTVHEAYKAVYEADPISIFGGIVAFNRKVSADVATELDKIFLEIIIAPEFEEEALDILKKKRNLRLIQADMTKTYDGPNIMSVDGGLLVQEADNAPNPELSFPTATKPNQTDIEQALFAWSVVKYVKSNAIVLAKNYTTVGIGPGQTNRIGAAKIAIENAGIRATGAVLASDAFFPMSDTVQAAATAGIKTIIQPGGSINDQDIIKECDKCGISMIFTGRRHFRH